MTNIKVRNITYKGWKNTIEISNSEIKIIVVSEVGRIMHYGFLDGLNILYENDQLQGTQFSTGKYFKENNIIQAPNIGGNRVLPCSEEYFAVLTGSRHLPDPFINASPYKATLLDNGVLLKSPLSKLLGVQLERTITVLENGTTVKIEQKLIKKTAAKDKNIERIPLTIWSLSKIKTPNISFLPINKDSVFEDGFFIPKWPDAKNNASINTTINKAILELKSSKNTPQKVGADSKNWVASYLNKTLFIEKFNFENKNSYPDGGTSVTIFGNHLFSELECLSPERKLNIGETICYNLQWSLRKAVNKSNAKEILQNVKDI